MTALKLDQLQVCLDLIDQSLYANCPKDVEGIWLQLRQHCNVIGLALSVAETSDKQHIKAPTTLAYGFPEGWFIHYKQRNYVLVDPVVKMGFQYKGVYSWAEAFATYGQHPDSQDFLQHAINEGLTNGYAIATTKHSLSSIASVCSVYVSNDISGDQIKLLYRILPHINEIMSRPGFLNGPHLTSRECEVITLAEGNVSNIKIALKLNISERTVKFHFNNIYKKLNVHNKLEAIQKAKILGVIK